MRKLFSFHGGIHPPSHKEQSTSVAIQVAPMPSKLVIPFHQHVGNIAKPLVEAGQYVRKGELIGKPQDGISSAIHASTSGTISAINMEIVAHPSGLADLCATLIPDGKDEWVELHPVDYKTLSTSEIRTALRMAGVVGLGGAAFPSDLKLGNGQSKIHTLILNGAECEPYITCDDRIMQERANDILQGALILQHILQAETVVVAIEDNKPEALKAMSSAAAQLKQNIEVVGIPTIYPGGSAKQLIRVITGQEIAISAKTLEYGVQCFNVGTAYSIYRALTFGEPLISRVVTITGNVQQAGNFETLVGTPVNELLNHYQPQTDTNRYIMGGPMMGLTLPSPTVSIVKASNCIIAASDKLFPPPAPAMPCIRCTRCVQACPAELQPQDLYWFSKSQEFGKAQERHLFDCIECGACSYVCPSSIPLVQYFRFAKSEIWARDGEKRASEKARERFEFREYRLEREKQEKAAKLAAKEQAAREKAAAAQSEPAVDSAAEKIKAAQERAKQQAASAAPKNVENLTPQQQAEIAEIEAKRAHIRELAQSHVEHNKE